MQETKLKEFIAYCNKHIKGDEKGEAQIFLDHFFTALGYPEGLKGAGANCEYRIRNEKKRTTSFADLVWKPRVLIEMKKRGEDLSLHYQQASSYWLQLVPNRPEYVILCNFDEFWIYNLNRQLYDPLDKIPLDDIVRRKEAFAFLLPKPQKPVFGKDQREITEKAANYVAQAFKLFLLPSRPERVEREDALRYCMQCIVSMFSEDVNLLPDKIFTRLIEECEEKEGDSRDVVPFSYDLIGGLFKEMNSKGVSKGERYKGVDYFNGGLFSEIVPISLTGNEIRCFRIAANEYWGAVNPAIFGTIFEQGMEADERHEFGAHYTHEKDIKRIVDPVIVTPWKRKIDAAKNLDEFYELLTELRKFKVLDPACGSGNFLFIAFKEIKLLEKTLLSLIRENSKKPAEGKRLEEYLRNNPSVNTKQFYGIDIKPYAVELAKVTLMVAKELWITQNKDDFDNEGALPLDNLDENIVCADSLFTKWPEVNAIIGNPPYQSKNKMQEEFGAEYVNKLHQAYPEVPGRADFCVYWFYKAHQNLKPDCYAGLVGTNTIRQNYSREASLDYIVKHGGTIIDAVSSERWSGDAAVHVSIACWKKGKEAGEKTLYVVDEKDNLQLYKVPIINSSLSLKTDVTSAEVLECNKKPKTCFQGQTHGNDGFLLSIKQAKKLLSEDQKNSDILKPFLIGDELVGNIGGQPARFVIDFSKMDMMKASSYKHPFEILREKVLPEIKEKAALEKAGKIKANGREAWLKMWWKMWRRREDMLDATQKLNRYIACARVTQRPIFEFLDPEIRPNDKVMVFVFEDDYSFGIIQSSMHWKWFLEKCTTLGETPNYNTEAIWYTFPWPQKPTEKQIEKVAKAAKDLRDARNKVMKDYNYTLRALYRILEQPGKNPINDLQTALDKAVMEAYGFDEKKDILAQLLELNHKVHEAEEKDKKVQAPGLPDWVKSKGRFITNDCIKFIEA